MTRDEMTEILIKDLILDWVFKKDYEKLEVILCEGWEGFENFTKKELEEAFLGLNENKFNKDTAFKIGMEKRHIKEKPVRKIELHFKF